MTPETLLTKSVTLLFLESMLEKNTSSSADLVKVTVSRLRDGEVSIGGPKERSLILELKELVIKMCDDAATATYEKRDFMQSIRLITKENKTVYTAIDQGINEELAGSQLKKAITSIRRLIQNYFNEQKVGDVIGKAFSDLRHNRQNITNFTAYIDNLIVELTAASGRVGMKDAAIVRSMDIGDVASSKEVFKRVIDANSGSLPFNTGFVDLNTALQGGPRPGDTMVIGALQHSYKTGLGTSLTANFAILNTPKCQDPEKRPLIYRVTFEDPVANNAQFLYQYLKFCETREEVSIKGVSDEEMSSYIKQRIQEKGYSLIIDEVNPTEWTHMSLINRILELESMGYFVEVVVLDYLSKMSPAICKTGRTDTDYMEQLSRVRAFCSANGKLCVTPHQLSTKAKDILQATPAEQFLHVIRGGGHFEHTHGLDRIYDIGLLINIVNSPSGDYLHCLVDKHRFPTPVDIRAKSFFLPFPSNKMPIPMDVFDENHRTLRKIPKSAAQNKADQYFI